MSEDNRLLKPLGTGKVILTEKEALEEIDGLKANEQNNTAPGNLIITPQNFGKILGVVAEYNERDASANDILTKQEDWAGHYNALKATFAAVPHYYNTAKQGKTKIISRVQEDFEKKFIVTSTMIKFTPKTLEGKIIHNYRNAQGFEHETKCLIPDYGTGITLAHVLNEKQGIEYMQALLNTNDNAEQIMKNLEILSGKNQNEIMIWTINQQDREWSTRMPILLYYQSGPKPSPRGIFTIGCGNMANAEGYSRKVI